MVELADTSGLSPDGLSVRVQVSLPSPMCQRVGIGRRGGLKNRCFMRVSSSLTVDTNEMPCDSRHLKKRCCFYITVKCAVRTRCYDVYIDRKSKQPTNLTIQGVDTICFLHTADCVGSFVHNGVNVWRKD